MGETQTLQRRFSELLQRRKTERRRQMLITVAFYAAAASVVALPLNPWWVAVIERRWMPLLFLLACAPFVWWKMRWRSRETIRAIADTDRRLRLDERAITAWEILGRGTANCAEELVLAQTEERLQRVDIEPLHQRQQLNWQAYLVLPLLFVWLAFSWLDPATPPRGGLGTAPPASLAHTLREFARELQQRAEDEGLRETLQAGRELEKFAQREIEMKASDESLKSALTGIGRKFEAAGRAAPPPSSFATGASPQALKDLKTELAAARDLLNASGGADNQSSQQWLDRLAGLPQLKQQLEQYRQEQRGLSPDDLEAFLDRLENQVKAEADRRALLEAQQFLAGLTKNGQGRQGENDIQVAGQGKQDLPDTKERGQGQSSRPGKEPGRKSEETQPAGQVARGATTQVKGRLGQGPSSGVEVKGKPSDGKSEISQENVVAAYRRQAEAELNSERVPEALKETIRNYFLSLDEYRQGDKETGRQGQ